MSDAALALAQSLGAAGAGDWPSPYFPARIALPYFVGPAAVGLLAGALVARANGARRGAVTAAALAGMAAGTAVGFGAYQATR